MFSPHNNSEICWRALWISLCGRFDLETWQSVIGCTIPVVAVIWSLLPLVQLEQLGLQQIHLLWLLA